MPVQTSPIEKQTLTLTIDLAPATENIFVTPPDPEATVTYETLGRLVRASLPEGT